MSNKRNKRNNKSVLQHLKAKRARFNVGGYSGGYTGGSRNRSDSQPYIPAEEENDTYQNYQGDDYDQVNDGTYQNGDGPPTDGDNDDSNDNTSGNGPGPWWAQKGYSSMAEAVADGWTFVYGQGWTKTGSGNDDSGGGTPTTTGGEGRVDPNRTDRTQRTGQSAEAMAQGVMPDNMPQDS